MKNFEEWAAGKGIQLNELNAGFQNMLDKPVTSAMQMGLDRLQKASAPGANTSTGQRKILSAIWSQAKDLTPQFKRKLAQILIQSLKDPVGDQAINPRARYDNGNGGL